MANEIWYDVISQWVYIRGIRKSDSDNQGMSIILPASLTTDIMDSFLADEQNIDNCMQMHEDMELDQNSTDISLIDEFSSISLEQQMETNSPQDESLEEVLDLISCGVSDEQQSMIMNDSVKNKKILKSGAPKRRLF